MMTVTRTGAGWRVKVGAVIFVASFAWPVLLPVLPPLGASGTDVAAFVGVMAVAAEIMLVAGAAIAGKDGFAFIKARVFGFKNVEVGLSGGWLVNRIYFKDRDLRDFGWMLHYTGSASRWVDGYVAAGWEYDVVDTDPGHTRARNLFVTETGIKLRVNIHHTPMKFLAKLGTDFWGLRVGIRTTDIWEFDRIGYVFEFGGGSW